MTATDGLTPALKAAATHARTAAPTESCGLLVELAGTISYLPAKNLAAGPRQQFKLTRT